MSGGFLIDLAKWGESSEAAISRHTTAENATQSEFQKSFSTFTLK
ncbi:hypothetical protein [Nostoc sp. FACHB-892]|nr:hypothetical protein [Nostoc sp. FACHB-892]